LFNQVALRRAQAQDEARAAQIRQEHGSRSSPGPETTPPNNTTFVHCQTINIKTSPRRRLSSSSPAHSIPLSPTVEIERQSPIPARHSSKGIQLGTKSTTSVLNPENEHPEEVTVCLLPNEPPPMKRKQNSKPGSPPPVKRLRNCGRSASPRRRNSSSPPQFQPQFRPHFPFSSERNGVGVIRPIRESPTIPTPMLNASGFGGGRQQQATYLGSASNGGLRPHPRLPSGSAILTSAVSCHPSTISPGSSSNQNSPPAPPSADPLRPPRIHPNFRKTNFYLVLIPPPSVLPSSLTQCNSVVLISGI